MKRLHWTAALFAAAAVAATFPCTARAAALDGGEENHLVFMREEEKLARDVYLTLGEFYPQAAVFRNISTSEQKHTDTIKFLLYLYGVEDPNPGTDDLPGSIGVFTGAAYGAYFRGKFEELTERGFLSLLEGLKVGAYIEELDMLDIAECPLEIVLQDNGIGEGECGLSYTDEQALIKSYTNLLEASKNHLRAYVRNIESITGTGSYVSQVLPQDVVDAILDEEPRTRNRRNRGGR